MTILLSVHFYYFIFINDLFKNRYDKLQRVLIFPLKGLPGMEESVVAKLALIAPLTPVH